MQHRLDDVQTVHLTQFPHHLQGGFSPAYATFWLRSKGRLRCTATCVLVLGPLEPRPQDPPPLPFTCSRRCSQNRSSPTTASSVLCSRCPNLTPSTLLRTHVSYRENDHWHSAKRQANLSLVFLSVTEPQALYLRHRLRLQTKGSTWGNQ